MEQLGPYGPYIVLAIIGLIAGWLSGLLLGGGGLIRDLIVGVIGAFVGTFLLKFLTSHCRSPTRGRNRSWWRPSALVW